ncbi:hypothetical protein HRG_010272 [Hirsutella rhossiliensis]|uniref:Alpha/beta hydrolase fold-3 domain-containing protein n=1 Tax=Hirsutella rhossiliensis TaxID=111463 RepID=A0A9P8MNX5_9HYPO|nr:uncharacterized protein HRG_10272 [Hirsutella rhossiliensis]KAH0958585.1 hypothetical protein HRG_10272 [Hirsutella rhossiliensis]
MRQMASVKGSMPACLPVVRAVPSLNPPRPFSTRSPERILVPCGSASYVSIDLFNSPQDSPKSALLVHLPAFPSADGSVSRVPKFLEDLPVASINYRWQAAASRDPAPLCWPMPVHDTAFAFAWLVDNLAPPGNSRRDIYVYGSHLGASLATSLSLTEAHAHARFGVRGLVAYNGIYNWTMFLPDHRINKRAPSMMPAPELDEASHLRKLQGAMAGLFDKPSNLFDPFASPSLFFHSPGMLQPRSFSMSTEDAAMIDALTGDQDAPSAPPKAPRKSHLIFPPRKSTLKIPQTLLLHDASRQPPRSSKAPKNGQARRKAKAAGHSLAAQAEELAELMRRSVSVIEMKERCKWDEEVVEDDQVQRRVQVVEVGPETGSIELNDGGQQTALEWLQDRM